MRPKPIKVRDDAGKLYVILEIVSTASSAPSADEPRYELPNRTPVARVSETEFVVIQNGKILTQL